MTNRQYRRRSVTAQSTWKKSAANSFLLAICTAIGRAVLAIFQANRQIMRTNIAATVRARLIG